MGLFTLIARLTMNTSGFESGARKVEGIVGGMANRLKGQLAAAFSIGAFVALEKQAITFGAKMKDLSVRVGVTTDEIQALNYAAEQSGANIEDMVRAVSQFNRVRGEVLSNPSSNKAGLLASIGLDAEKLRTTPALEVIKQLAKDVQGNRFSNSDRGYLLQMMFGESGEKLIPVFSAGLDEAAQSLERIGGLIDRIDIENLKQADDLLTDIKRQMIAIAAEASPLVKETMQAVSFTAKVIGTAIRDGISITDAGVKVSSGIASNSLKVITGSLLRSAGKKFGSALGFQPDPVQELLNSNPAAKTQFSRTNLGVGSLASIGGFVGLGGTRNVQLDVAKEQLAVQKKIERNTATTEDEGF